MDDLHAKAMRQKTIGIWLILGGFAGMFFKSPALLFLGLIALVAGFVMFISGRMKQ